MTANDDEHGQIFRARRTELDPNAAQRILLKKHADAARFAWNWALGRKKQVMDLNHLPIEHIKIPTAFDLHRELNRLKRTDFPWLYEASKCASQEALRDLDRAFKNLYESHFGFPKFKSKRWAKKSFRLTGSIVVADNAVKLPRIGWVRLKERGYLLPEGAAHITGATVSETAGRWFVVLQVAEEPEVFKPPANAPIVGVDLGISALATVSEGTVYANPKAYPTLERKLKRLQRTVSRKQKDSNNRRKAMKRLQRHHFRIANVRMDAINKATSELAKTKSVIVVESLRPRLMVKNHRLAKSLHDAALGEFVRQLEYKTLWFGSKLVKADPFFPSTKRCSSCGSVKDTIPLDERIYRCECGLVIDRDLNAALNLSQWPSVRRTRETPVRAGMLQAERPVLGVEAGIKAGQTGLSCLSII